LDAVPHGKLLCGDADNIGFVSNIISPIRLEGKLSIALGFGHIERQLDDGSDW